ncbi:class I SAM-dependent methyltransferase [Rhodospira trueperi]|uniref:Methyltransferase domain-containing protein n=1 Tax=Rhodospira trueperi TaxID=69960 RepID=A0A1G7FPN7_9PROT|nr:class I SAM-dependent methyltransferase [Rhodospira trueperi]SDE77758.1 Methyltransferase domain-containing protein [Rhodospira trueperi]
MPETRSTDTAHHHWNETWADAAGRADWLTPEPDVHDLLDLAEARGAATFLDLGCGVGRHALLASARGLRVTGLDGAAEGLAQARLAADRAGLPLDLREGVMTELPFPDASFDVVLAWNVIYHGDRPIVERAIAEIRRVLRPGGLYQGTMLSKRNTDYGKGTEVAPDTFVLDGVSDKAHPHFYCNACELVALFDGFELLSLRDVVHHRPGSWHWHMVAERADTGGSRQPD